jgi:hypothetical protein
MFNVIRNEAAPASLTNRQSHSEQDVLDALSRVFNKKCYICETKEPIDINVEHFEPHLGDLDKKFNWDNLYFSCGRCNNIKLAKYDDLLDCCDPSVDVLRLIKHVPPITPYAKCLRIEAQHSDEKTRLTTELIGKVFNSTHTPNKTVSASFLRKRVFQQFNLFLDLQRDYFAELTLPAEKETALERMKLLIKASSQYSAFISWCVLDDDELAPLLNEFIGA